MDCCRNPPEVRRLILEDIVSAERGPKLDECDDCLFAAPEMLYYDDNDRAAPTP